MKKINLGQKDIIHFIGIGGIGMSGLAQVMKTMGFKIQGSDQNKNKSTYNCFLHNVFSQIFCGKPHIFIGLVNLHRKARPCLPIYGLHILIGERPQS